MLMRWGRRGETSFVTGPGSRFTDAARAFRRLAPERSGSVAVIFALSGMAVVGLAGAGIDYARLAARRTQLQSATDAGVLTAGNYLKLALSTSATVTGIAEQTIRTEAKASADSPLTIQVTVTPDKSSVAAVVGESVKLAFGSLLGMSSVAVSVNAKASVVGRMRLCMLTLDPIAPSSFALQKNARLTASNCSLYANSKSPQSMSAQDSAYARAQTICTAGGFSGTKANFAPPPQTGCPTVEDPLKDRPEPPVGACMAIPSAANSAGVTIKNDVDVSVTLDPGTYCGGLHITKNAAVTLRPGIYVFRNGPLIVDKSASLSGTEVGFFFTGNRGGLVFDKKTTISLSAPTSGVMAGLLMMEERSVYAPVDPVGKVELDYGDVVAPTPPPISATQPMRIYRIISDNARTMLGTLYLPAGRVVIDASRPVADQSAYTVIVAQQVNLFEGPNLILNTNYDATAVPVPKGVGPISGRLLLTQ